MNKYVEWHFDVQKGMYFDNVKQTNEFSYFSSKIIEDSYWNYALFKDSSVINELSLMKMESLFKAGKRTPCVYMIGGNDSTMKALYSYGYDLLFKESFMTLQRINILSKKQLDIRVRRVTNEKERSDFMNVFISAYGGEKTPEQPYGELDKSYYEALTRSFSQDQKFYHFICYEGEQAASIATLCFLDGKGGIYNVGTSPMFRGKGFGSSVTNACIYQWEIMKGDVLFLQTESGSAVERWYQKMGFKSVFTGSGLAKRI